MKYKFSQRSIDNLKGVHPVLIAIAYRALALSPHDFGVVDGLRTAAEQKKLLEEGKTQVTRSKHLTGHAIDIAVWKDGKFTWHLPYYQEVSKAFLKAAAEFNAVLVWGGDWDGDGDMYDHSFIDGPHFEIDPNTWK